MRKVAAVSLVGATVAAAFFLAPRNDHTPTRPLSAPQRAVAAINRHRVAEGLPKLTADRTLARDSRRWSSTLARLGTFRHATLPTGWRWVGETLYRGPGGPVGPWLNSLPHRAILLSRQPRLVGVGRSGDVWVGRFARK